jgi:hypothetical protein
MHLVIAAGHHYFFTNAYNRMSKLLSPLFLADCVVLATPFPRNPVGVHAMRPLHC